MLWKIPGFEPDSAVCWGHSCRRMRASRALVQIHSEISDDRSTYVMKLANSLHQNVVLFPGTVVHMSPYYCC